MYGYLSKAKQSLALKLMAIYTLKSNILRLGEEIKKKERKKERKKETG